MGKSRAAGFAGGRAVRPNVPAQRVHPNTGAKGDAVVVITGDLRPLVIGEALMALQTVTNSMHLALRGRGNMTLTSVGWGSHR